MVDYATKRPKDNRFGKQTSGEHRLLACRFRQLAESQSKGVTTQHHRAAFTLAELVITVGVLVLLVFLFTQLLNSAATVMTLGHKRMDADSQAREVLDRMAIDFAQMVKRADVDYYVKSSAAQPLRNVPQPGNDRIAFYATVPGYYGTVPTPAPTFTTKSPVSLVGYRINADSTSASYNRMERMGKGLAWNGFSSSAWTPVVFMPIPLAFPLPVGELPSPTPSPIPTPAWPVAASATAAWTDSEVIGPQVFRFEYYYLVQGRVATGAVPSPSPTPAPPILSDIPWDARICTCPPSPTPTASPTPTITPPAVCCHTAPQGMQDVVAVVVAIAVIDAKSRVLVTDAQLARLNGADGLAPVLVNFSAGMTPGQLLAQWRAALDANTIGLPLAAISGIRVYERYLYLSPPTLLTP